MRTETGRKRCVRALLVLLLASVLGGCGWWRSWRSGDGTDGANPPPREPPPPSVPRQDEPAPVARPVTLPPPNEPPPAATRPLQRMPDDATPVLDMRRDPEGSGYLVTLRPESGLPILAPGASRADFDRAVERLGAVIVAQADSRVEVAPGGAYDGLELPLRVFYEFDAGGRFVRTTGDF